MTKIGIISYCDSIRTFAYVNHEYYAKKNNYKYIYDISPTKQGIFKNKIEKILKFIDLFDWIFWIDDDAFFLQFNKKLEKFIKNNENNDLIFCSSPVNKGKKTYISSGNFFIKNSKTSKKILKEVLLTPLDKVKKQWKEEYGFFTNGDQDIIIHLLKQNKYKKIFKILPFNKFNCRDFHFQKSYKEYFLVHFAGVENKQKSIENFANKFKLSPALIPKKEFIKFNKQK